MAPITADQLSRRYRDNPGSVILLDVRTPTEFKSSRIKFAKNCPLDQLDPHQLCSVIDKDREVLLICQSGMRSKKAAERLVQQGFQKVLQVEGGMNACKSVDLPVEQGETGLSLERQVRITAGSIVVLGSLLSLLVHPYLVIIALFIGGGLVFSGVTDTCGMGNILARMPWNR